MFPIIPKNPPEGFQDYLVSRRTYVLAGKTPTTPNISYPPSLLPQMQDLFTEQEKERYKLKMQVNYYALFYFIANTNFVSLTACDRKGKVGPCCRARNSTGTWKSS